MAGRGEVGGGIGIRVGDSCGVHGAKGGAATDRAESSNECHGVGASAISVTTLHPCSIADTERVGTDFMGACTSRLVELRLPSEPCLPGVNDLPEDVIERLGDLPVGVVALQ